MNHLFTRGIATLAAVDFCKVDPTTAAEHAPSEQWGSYDLLLNDRDFEELCSANLDYNECGLSSSDNAPLFFTCPNTCLTGQGIGQIDMFTKFVGNYYNEDNFKRLRKQYCNDDGTPKEYESYLEERLTKLGLSFFANNQDCCDDPLFRFDDKDQKCQAEAAGFGSTITRRWQDVDFDYDLTRPQDEVLGKGLPMTEDVWNDGKYSAGNWSFIRTDSLDDDTVYSLDAPVCLNAAEQVNDSLLDCVSIGNHCYEPSPLGALARRHCPKTCQHERLSLNSQSNCKRYCSGGGSGGVTETPTEEVTKPPTGGVGHTSTTIGVTVSTPPTGNVVDTLTTTPVHPTTGDNWQTLDTIAGPPSVPTGDNWQTVDTTLAAPPSVPTGDNWQTVDQTEEGSNLPLLVGGATAGVIAVGAAGAVAAAVGGGVVSSPPAVDADVLESGVDVEMPERESYVAPDTQYFL